MSGEKRGSRRIGVLLRFDAANYRSILEPVELSMIAVDKDRPSTRGFDLLTERVLTTAGIYGPNASGKSNVIEALAWLSTAVGRSLRTWDQFIPREPFKFGQGPETSSTFEVEMVVRGDRRPDAHAGSRTRRIWIVNHVGRHLMAGHQHVEVSDDGRTVAAAEVIISEEPGGTARVSLRAESGHITPDRRASLVDAVLDLPQVRESARLEAAFPLGDGESLQRLQQRCQDVTTRPAGCSALRDARLPSGGPGARGRS